MAKLQFAADTMRIVTRMEYSRFKRWVSNELEQSFKICEL